jgi:hypothetical protein
MPTAEAVATAITALSAAYRREVDKAQILTWGRALVGVDDPDLAEAVEAWIRSSPKFPVPAEIIQTAKIIAKRRIERERQEHRALPAPQPGEEQRARARQEIARARNALAQGKLRVGENLDEYLDGDDKEAEEDAG